MPLLFQSLHHQLHDVAAKIDVIFALGTHPGLPEDLKRKLLGITSQNEQQYKNVDLINHEWNNPEALSSIGSLSVADTERITEGRLSELVYLRRADEWHKYASKPKYWST